MPNNVSIAGPSLRPTQDANDPDQNSIANAASATPVLTQRDNQPASSSLNQNTNLEDSDSRTDAATPQEHAARQRMRRLGLRRTRRATVQQTDQASGQQTDASTSPQPQRLGLIRKATSLALLAISAGQGVFSAYQIARNAVFVGNQLNNLIKDPTLIRDIAERSFNEANLGASILWSGLTGNELNGMAQTHLTKGFSEAENRYLENEENLIEFSKKELGYDEEKHGDFREWHKDNQEVFTKLAMGNADSTLPVSVKNSDGEEIVIDSSRVGRELFAIDLTRGEVSRPTDSHEEKMSLSNEHRYRLIMQLDPTTLAPGVDRESLLIVRLQSSVGWKDFGTEDTKTIFGFNAAFPVMAQEYRIPLKLSIDPDKTQSAIDQASAQNQTKAIQALQLVKDRKAAGFGNVVMSVQFGAGAGVIISARNALSRNIQDYADAQIKEMGNRIRESLGLEEDTPITRSQVLNNPDLRREAVDSTDRWWEDMRAGQDIESPGSSAVINIEGETIPLGNVDHNNVARNRVVMEQQTAANQVPDDPDDLMPTKHEELVMLIDSSPEKAQTWVNLMDSTMKNIAKVEWLTNKLETLGSQVPTVGSTISINMDLTNIGKELGAHAKLAIPALVNAVALLSSEGAGLGVAASQGRTPMGIGRQIGMQFLKIAPVNRQEQVEFAARRAIYNLAVAGGAAAAMAEPTIRENTKVAWDPLVFNFNLVSLKGFPNLPKLSARGPLELLPSTSSNRNPDHSSRSYTPLNAREAGDRAPDGEDEFNSIGEPNPIEFQPKNQFRLRPYSRAFPIFESKTLYEGKNFADLRNKDNDQLLNLKELRDQLNDKTMRQVMTHAADSIRETGSVIKVSQDTEVQETATQSPPNGEYISMSSLNQMQQSADPEVSGAASFVKDMLSVASEQAPNNTDDGIIS